MNEVMLRADEYLSARTRTQLYTREQLRPLLAPGSVAIIGASERPGFGTMVVKNLLARGLGEQLYVVNPRYEQVHGVKCYPSAADLPDKVDCAVLTIGGAHAVGLFREIAERGTRAALVHAAGFAETGREEGIARQRELIRIARDYDIRLSGPNVLGLMNLRDGIFLGGHYDDTRAGRIGIVTQSGGLGLYLSQYPAPGESLFSHVLCAGNSADVDSLDLANFVLQDEDTTAVCICLEGVSNVERLLALGETSRATEKPVIVYKAGRTERGAQAALSHTGSLAGTYEVVQAAFRRANFIEVETYEDIVETALFMSRAKRPTGKGVGVVTGMGGVAVMACDMADEAGVDLPPLAPQTLKKLRDLVPEYGTFTNPADLTATAGGGGMFERGLQIMTEDPNFDLVVMPLAPALNLVEDRQRVVGRVAAKAACSIAVYWTSQWLEGPGTEVLAVDPNVGTFRSMRRLFRAVRKWRDWHANLTAPMPDRHRSEAVGGGPSPVVSLLIGAAPTLSEATSREICLAAGIPVASGGVATSADAAARIAAEVGYPVVVKAVSADLPHKSEAGAVVVGVADEASVRAAYDTVWRNARSYAPDAELDGALVAKMYRGVELLVGARRDPVLGPVVVCGIGGVNVELFGKPEVELAPLDQASAEAMLTRIAGANLLDGYRGAPRADVAAVGEILVRLSELMMAEPRIAEADLNPVLVGAAGRGAVVADAMFVVTSDADAAAGKGHS